MNINYDILKNFNRELRIYPHDNRWRARVIIFGENLGEDTTLYSDGTNPEDALRSLANKLAELGI